MVNKKLEIFNLTKRYNSKAVEMVSVDYRKVLTYLKNTLSLNQKAKIEIGVIVNLLNLIKISYARRFYRVKKTKSIVESINFNNLKKLKEVSYGS